MPLRVLWVLKGLGPGGAERLLVEAANTHHHEQFSIDCAYVLPWKDHLAEDLERAGVHTICLGRDRSGRGWTKALRSLIRSGAYDVVHVHSPLPGSVARLVVRRMPKSQRPAVMSTEHNTWGTHRLPTRWANRLTGRWDSAILAVTGEAKSSMRGPGAERAEVLAHGIDVGRVRALRSLRDEVRREFGVPEGVVTFGTVANFREQKDYPNLLAAARTLADRGVPFRVIAVGQGPQEAEIRSECTRLGLDDVVTLTGFRPDATRVMAGCDVFTMASKWEGLPVALMEALALGLPVVATAVGGIAETLDDSVDALLVPPSDSTALADAWQRVIDDVALRAGLAEAAAARADEFDTSRATARIEELYRSIAPTRAAAAGDDPPPTKQRRGAPAGIDVRLAIPDDRDEIIALCRASLGWGDDERFERLYAWKHDENAFGPSPTWVAVEDGRIIALRAFMRWEFQRGGSVLRAVRAVDTATHPDHQGKGLFTLLTMHGLDEVRADGVDFVFNTPNDKSRPGYLKMGWQTVGRLPAVVRLRGPGSAATVARSRVAATHWPAPLDIGEPFTDWFERHRGALPLDPIGGDVRTIRTNVTPDFLAWRYGAPMLGYRVLDADDGAVIVRARQRGAGRELVVLAALGIDQRQADRVVGKALGKSGCSHALRLGAVDARTGFVPIPGGGPVLTWRDLNQQAMPPLSNWQLGMGEVELF